jgi:hypothetical protein
MKAKEINTDERQNEGEVIFSYYGSAHRSAIHSIRDTAYKQEEWTAALVVLENRQLWDCFSYEIR